MSFDVVNGDTWPGDEVVVVSCDNPGGWSGAETSSVKKGEVITEFGDWFVVCRGCIELRWGLDNG